MKLFIGICNSQETVPSGFFWTFLNIVTRIPVKPFRATHPWDVVRNNQIIAEFLKSDCDVMAKMDIDQLYPSCYFERFLPLVEKYKVIGPLIKDRHIESGFMPLAFSSHDGMMLRKFPIVGHSGIIEVPYPHTNLFYAREVLEAIEPPWYEAHLADGGLERKNHVDFTFLDKIKEAGYSIYIDLSTKVAHQYEGYTT